MTAAEAGGRDPIGAASRFDAVVIGAGPAGLSAAWELVRAGRSVLVVEAAEAPGGLCRSHERDGFYFDYGGHRFITKNRELFERVEGLLGDELRVRERESVIRIGDRDYRYPLDLREVLRGEGLVGIARVLASWLAARVRAAGSRRGDASEHSLESWVRSRFGSAIFDRFFRDYTLKLWGIGAGELSADWAGQRISQIDLRDVVRNALGAERRARRTFAKKYCYPRHGIGQIFSRLARELRDAGVEFRFATRPRRVEIGARVEVELDGRGETGAVSCEHLVSTMPLPDLVALLNAPPEVARAASGLRFRSLRFLNVLLDGPPLSSKTWIYVPEARFPMTRIQFPANRSPENVPPGKTSVQLEIPCEYDDAIWRSGADELLESCLPALDAMGFDLDSRVLASFATGARHAYPVYRAGYKDARSLSLEWIDGLSGIHTCGRQGRFDYIFFDRAMEQGFAAAARVLGRESSVATRADESDPLLPEEARSIIEGGVGETSRSRSR